MKVKYFSKKISIVLALLVMFSSLPNVPVSADPNPLNAVIPKYQEERQFGFSAGGLHTVWFDTSHGGDVTASGNNDYGQLGDGTTISRSLPVTINNLYSRVADISAGGTHNLALIDDQTVRAWGNNQKGQLGIGSDINSLIPVEVPGLSEIIAISSGFDFSLALKNDGTVYSFGSNEFNQLGDSSVGSRNTPAQIPVLDSIVAIAAGGTHALALHMDGSVYAWGSNERGELGDGGSASGYQPVKIASLSNITAISAGLRHCLALGADGSVYAWGDNSLGQLGDPKISDYSNVPIKVQGIKAAFRIAAGYNSSFIIAQQNATYGFGDNSANQINSSAVENLSSPTLLNIKASFISPGWGHTVSRGFLGNDNGVDNWSWGYNQFGQTGNGLTEHVLNPTAPYSGTNRQPVFFRISGANRFKTAVAISIEGWDYGAATVVLARADNFPDALAGTPLAYGLNAPILLTDSARLSNDTKDELDRLAPQNIIILGQEGAISSSIEKDLQKHYKVTRVGGQDRYETAAAIAQYMHDHHLILGNKAVIAYGENFPDALAVSSVAAHAHMPILLTKKDVLADAAGEALKRLGINETFIVGGTGVVGTAVESSLPLPTRYSGNDRYATAIAIANGMGTDPYLVYLATGTNFPDALAGSVLAARSNSPIILVNSSSGAEAAAQWFWWNSRDIKQSYVLGGSGAVPDSVIESIYSRIGY